MQVITTKFHGKLDYLTGVLLIALPWILGFNDVPVATWAVIFVGVAIIMMSLFTDYESGIVKAISMATHLNIDIVTGLLLAASPWIFGFADQVFLPHLIAGLYETIVALMTSRNAPGQPINELHGL